MHKPVVIWLLTYSYNYSQCIAVVSQHIPTTPPTPFKCLVSSHIYPITLYSHKMCTWMEFHCSLAKFPWWCTHLNELLTSAFSLVGSTFIKPHFFETSPFDASKTWETAMKLPVFAGEIRVFPHFLWLKRPAAASLGAFFRLRQSRSRGGLSSAASLRSGISGASGRVPWQRSIWLASGYWWLMSTLD